MNMLKMRRSILTSSSAAILIAGLASAPALAQQAAADGQGDIIVTANKRAERQIDVPSSITSFRGEELLDRGITNLRDYLTLTPGVQINQGYGGGAPIIRGLNTGQDLGAVVGIVVDGAPIGAGASYANGGGDSLDLDPIDLERVEVLKGPQGTLYGANTLGGLVSYTLATPSLNEISAVTRGELSGTQHGEANWSIRAAASAPLVQDKLALRLSGYLDRPGGFIDNNVQNVSNQNDQKNWGLSATLRFKPDPRLEIKLSGIYQRVKKGIRDQVVYGPNRQPLNDLHYDEIVSPTYGKKVKVGLASIDYDLDFAKLSSVTSYQKISSELLFNFSNQSLTGLFAILPAFGGQPIPAGVGYGFGSLQDTRRFTQEMRLTSSGDGPLQYVVGVYYDDEKTDGPIPISALTPDLVPVPTLNPVLGFGLFNKYKEVAGFGNLTWKLSDAFDITGGLRVGRSKQNFRETYFGSDADAFNAFLVATGQLPAPAVSMARGSKTVKNYLLAARYHFSKDGMIYARFATGFRPGGPNVQVGNSLPLNFKPDSTQNYEAGVKSKFLDGLGTIDISAYYLLWNDILVQAGSPITGFANGGDARVYGTEGTLTLRPIEGLSLVGTLSYSNGKVTRLDPVAVGAVGDGDPLPNSPRWSGSLSANYRKEVSDDTALTFGATGRFVGSRHSNLESSVVIPDYLMPSYALFDANAGLELKHISVSLFVRNLTDKRAQINATTHYGIDEITVQRPRTIGAAVTFRY